MFVEGPAEPEVKHSKIWLALNPQPLAFQTAEDKQDKEEKRFIGMVGMGNRNIDGSQAGAVGDGAGMDDMDMDVDEGAFDDDQDAERINDDADMEENLGGGGADNGEESDYSDSELTEDAIGNEDVDDTMKFLMEMRAKREKEEAENQAKKRAA
jgi:hypothetical protein